MRLLALFVLVGCGAGTLEIGETDDGGPIEDTDVEVEDTDEPEDTDEDPTDPIEDALDGECDPGKADGRVDIEAGCADGACAGMTYSQMAEALGDRGQCQAYEGYPGWTGCWWDRGISTSFRDSDSDGEPDATDWSEGLYIQFPFDGGTEEGLAPGASMSCYAAALGPPSSVSFESSEDGFVPSEMIWEDLGFMVWDAYTDVTYGQDGYSDYFLLQGALEP